MSNNTLTTDQKEQIKQDLQLYIETFHKGSANAASTSLKISNATVSNMLKAGDKWANISDEMWRKVKKQVSVGDEGEWKMVETKTFNDFKDLFDDAAKYALTFGIIAFSGSGKTATASYMMSQPNFYMVKCSDYFNKRIFLQKLLDAIGKPNSGYSVADMMETILDFFERADRPVIVLDEADKLSDGVLYFFISLYNHLEARCGLILMATDYLQKRIKNGVAINKKGYAEIYSRLGKKFMEIQPPSKDEQRDIIKANGIYDEQTINEIINKSDSDLRRVKRLVFAEKRKEAALA